MITHNRNIVYRKVSVYVIVTSGEEPSEESPYLAS